MRLRPTSWLSLLVATLLCIASPGAAEPPSAGAVVATMKSWLERQGLAPNLEVQKFRSVPRPSDATATWYVLELRLLSQQTERDAIEADYRQVLNAFEKDRGMSLADQLWFRLLQSSQRRPSELTVSIFVGDTKQVLARDRATGSMFFSPAKVRLDRVSFDLGPGTLVQQQLRAASTDSVAMERDSLALDTTATMATVTKQVRAAVIAFFKKCNKGAPAALQFAPQVNEENYVGVDVLGARGCGITDHGYWEKYQVGVELRPQPSGARAACYVDGAYATGAVGSASPKPEDYVGMDAKYKDQLRSLTRALAAAIQGAVTHTP